MRVVFYAPLKPPDHPVPSGDRQVARALLAALRTAGHQTSLATRFRSFDARGDGARQTRLRQLGGRLAQRLIGRFRRGGTRPDVWFTYHLYHKAPDWIGPVVSRALQIPYVVAEASLAGKQRDGPWAPGHAGALAAIEAADAMLFLNPVDIAAIRRVRGPGAIDELLPPFLDLAAFCGAAASRPPVAPERRSRVQLVTVAMMRPGAKLASYRLLAAALARISPLPWDLVVVGDGPARAEVEAAFAGFAPQRIRFVGALPSAEVAAQLCSSDLFLWPAIDEAFGMAFIEAQACRLPVVGGHSDGVAAVVDAGRSGLLVPLGDAEAFAAATQRLVVDAPMRQRMGNDAAAYASARHDLPAAAARIDALLRRVIAVHAPVDPADPHRVALR